MAAKKKSTKKKISKTEQGLLKRRKYLEELGYERINDKWKRNGKYWDSRSVKSSLARYDKTRKTSDGIHTIKWLQTIGVHPSLKTVSGQTAYVDIFEILQQGLDTFELAATLRQWYEENFDRELSHERKADWYMVAIE